MASPNHIWAGLSTITELAKKSDVPAAYIHPSTKVCTGGDAGTLNGKTAAQIINDASSAAKVVTIYDSTIDASSWTNASTYVRVYAYKFSSSDLYKYLAFSVYARAVAHYRTSTSYNPSGNQFTICLIKSGTYADWNTGTSIVTLAPSLPNTDNTTSAEYNFYGQLIGYNNSYSIENSRGSFAQIAVGGYVTDGILNGANLSGSSIYVKIQAIKA